MEARARLHQRLLAGRPIGERAQKPGWAPGSAGAGRFIGKFNKDRIVRIVIA